MAYEMVMPYHLHMPSYFLETFTEYPFDSVKFNPTRHFVKEVYRKGEKELEHADPTYGFKTSSSKHTQEERFGMLMEYLREYTFITR